MGISCCQKKGRTALPEETAGKHGGNASGFRRKTEVYRTMNAELEILGVKLKHYRVDAAMEIAEEYLSNDKLNTIGIVTMQMLSRRARNRRGNSISKIWI